MNIADINSYLDIVIKAYFMIFLFAKWKDIKTIFCEKDSDNMSSKRVIAIMGMYTLCKIAVLVTHPDKPVDPYILLTFTVIILLAAAIATFPQILDGLGKIKNIIPGGPGASQTITKETTIEKEKIENKSPEEQAEQQKTAT